MEEILLCLKILMIVNIYRMMKLFEQVYIQLAPDTLGNEHRCVEKWAQDETEQ